MLLRSINKEAVLVPGLAVRRSSRRGGLRLNQLLASTFQRIRTSLGRTARSEELKEFGQEKVVLILAKVKNCEVVSHNFNSCKTLLSFARMSGLIRIKCCTEN
jgi:hypothetical protein